MKIAIASFTRNGCAWNRKTLCGTEKNTAVKDMHWKKYGKEAGIPAIAPSLPAWTERMFQKNGCDFVYRGVRDCGAQYCTVREK